MITPHPRRVAVVHDWLLDFSGAERVLAEILRCYPDADLYALFDHMQDRDRARLGGRRARTTFLQNMPGIASRHQLYLPLMPLAIEQLDLTGYDLVISSSHAVAKGVIVAPDTLHVCSIYSPMRYAWDMQFTYLEAGGMQHGLKGALARVLLHRLRNWDHRSAAGVDRFVADSRFVARRVLKSYRRHADVIYPPVDTEQFVVGADKGDYYLTVSRLWPYKRVDLIVQAFAALPDRKLVIIGTGPDFARLKRMATPNVELLGYQPEPVVREHMQRARAFLFAAIEDFGIVPVEAQACGTPVIALGRGGAAETVLDLDGTAPPTGVLFREQTPQALTEAVRRFEAEAHRFTAAACRRHAESFAAGRFRAEFGTYVESAWTEWKARLG
jgi:glycosyltransferase involved in cell wall biosynthesis